MQGKAKINLLHISDIHFGPPHLGGRFEALGAFIKEQKIQGVILSGDVTQRAKRRQFQKAREFLQESPVPVIPLGGNHDVPLYAFWLRFLFPYKRYKKYFQPQKDLTFSFPGVRVHALSTAHGFTSTEGRITRKQLAFLKKAILRGSPSEWHVLALHHPPLPVPGGDRDRSIRGSLSLLSLLREYPVDLLLHGHTHRFLFYSVDQIYPKFPYLLPVVGCGTSTTCRSRMREKDTNIVVVLSFEENTLRIQPFRWWERAYQPFGEIALSKGVIW